MHSGGDRNYQFQKCWRPQWSSCSQRVELAWERWVAASSGNIAVQSSTVQQGKHWPGVAGVVPLFSQYLPWCWSIVGTIVFSVTLSHCHSIMEGNTITVMLNHLIQRRELKFVYFYVGGEVGTANSQYSLFIIIDKVTLTDSVNSRRGRKKRGDYQIIITKLTFYSLCLALYRSLPQQRSSGLCCQHCFAFELLPRHWVAR